MAKIYSVTGRYITIEVDDLECRVFWLENGEGPPPWNSHLWLRCSFYSYSE